MAKRVIIHWTAGTNQPCNEDMQHYHYLINKDGVVVQGIHKVSDNDNCKDGNYAQHTGGGNTGSIGVAVCGCYVPKGVAVKDTKYPLTRLQLERMFKLVAELCKEYGILPTNKTVMTHYEFGLANPKTSSAGKIDITYMHSFPNVHKEEIGNFIRNKVKWYLKELNTPKKQA